MNPDYSRQKIGRKLQVFRKLSGLTQREVGERLGVRALIICDLECGKTKVCLDRFLALVELYGLTDIQTFFDSRIEDLTDELREIQTERSTRVFS